MTIETTANRISYTGSGTTGPFSFPYYFLADGDLTVIKTTIADGTEVTMTLTTDYTVSGAGEAAGGSVTLVATLSSSYKLTIIRDPDILQPADYPANDRFPAATHEQALDRATMIMQRLEDLIARAFRLSDGDVSGISLILSNLSAGELIAVNSAGTGIESIAAADVDLTTVSAYIQTLLDDADAATARTTLNAASLAANTFTGIQRWAKGADVASATALTLGTDGNYFDITGTTTITSIGTLGVGTQVKLHFDGALTLTHHATDLVLPGGANITTAAGDEAEFVEYATDDWRCTSYVPAAFVPSIITQATAEAGTDTAPRLWTAERVAQAIAALGGGGVTSGTVVDTSTGATSYTVTGIPSGAKFISFGYGGISTNGTSSVMIRVGPSGGVVNTGYVGALFDNTTATQPTDGFYIDNFAAAAAVRHGRATLQLIDASTNTWSWRSDVLSSDTNRAGRTASGTISLAGALERFQLIANGTDTFDAGKLNYLVWE